MPVQPAHRHPDGAEGRAQQGAPVPHMRQAKRAAVRLLPVGGRERGPREPRSPDLAKRQGQNPGARGQKQKSPGHFLRHGLHGQEAPEMQRLPPAWTHPSLLSSEHMRQGRGERATSSHLPLPSQEYAVFTGTRLPFAALEALRKVAAFGVSPPVVLGSPDPDRSLEKSRLWWTVAPRLGFLLLAPQSIYQRGWCVPCCGSRQPGRGFAHRHSEKGMGVALVLELCP